MSSIADDLRRSLRQRMAQLSAEERLDLTGRLAEMDLEFFCAGQRLSREEARRALARRRHAGRPPSCAADAGRR
jgi:hypothetical protein